MEVENGGQGGPAQDGDWPVIIEVESGGRQQCSGREPQGTSRRAHGTKDNVWTKRDVDTPREEQQHSGETGIDDKEQGHSQGDRKVMRAKEERGHTKTCTAAPEGAAVHVGRAGLQDVRKTGMSQDGGIRKVTTDMRLAGWQPVVYSKPAA